MSEEPQVHFPPVENGMDYLISVMEHLDGAPGPRSLKYAVLHLQAATEVLLKARLIAFDWRLTFKKAEEADRAAFDRGGFQSCNVDTAIKRLRADAGVEVPSEAKGHITHLASQRNRLQHFGLTEPALAVRSRTVLVLDFLLDFVNQELRPHLSGDDLSSLDTHMGTVRESLSRVEALVTSRMARIQPELGSMARHVVQCVACGQWAMVAHEGATSCLFCGVPWEPEQAAEEYAAEHLGDSWFSMVKDGGSPPRYTCPACDGEALVQSVRVAAFKEEDRGFCFHCGEAFRNLTECAKCGTLIDGGEGALQVCETCFEYAMARN
ncbi:hypothetical protein ACH4TC_12120 [Streptomyces spororaveus]|uniref:hypothetical protein n=1 Tax=Streptomyces spororaveus TaxID=284039 RepID=UPI00379A9574